MKSSGQKLYRTVMKAIEDIQNAVNEADQDLKDTVCVEEQADLEFVLYKCDQLISEFRKTVERARKRRVYIMCIHFANTGRTEPVRTDYVTASPRVTYMPRLPSASNTNQRGEYQELLRTFGVPEEAIVQDLFRPHWPSFFEYVKQCEETGKPLPHGVMPERFPQYEVTHRSTKKSIIG